jgi:hypothetical protein
MEKGSIMSIHSITSIPYTPYNIHYGTCAFPATFFFFLFLSQKKTNIAKNRAANPIIGPPISPNFVSVAELPEDPEPPLAELLVGAGELDVVGVLVREVVEDVLVQSTLYATIDELL